LNAKQTKQQTVTRIISTNNKVKRQEKNEENCSVEFLFAFYFHFYK